MDWTLAPALAGAAIVTLIGVAAAVRPEAVASVGVAATSPLGRSEIRAVFGGMFVALGLACLITREPIVFAVVGAAWLADVAVRLISVFIDRVPGRDAVTVLAIGSLLGVAILSGYWAA